MLILILSHEATLKSWAIKYVGNTSDSLYKSLVSHSKEGGNYTKYISIVQSSGMGKSRAIDAFENTFGCTSYATSEVGR